MGYLKLIKNTELEMKVRFEELNSVWKHEPIFRDCTYHFSTSSLLNEHQLLDSSLSYYPKSINSEDEGVDICVSFVQSINTKKSGLTEFTSLIHFTEQGDLDLGQNIFITSDICTSSGAILFENETSQIIVKDIQQIEHDISICLDKLFSNFKNMKALVMSSLDKSNSR